jgi:hypothetical protein
MDMEKLKALTPLEVLIYWMNERHNIYLRRQAGQPWPWTDDPILQKHKFANVFRELDKTTKWMRENITNPHIDDPPELMIFNCALFRMVGTIEYSQAIGGWQDHFDPDKLIAVGEQLHAAGKPVFTAAYIVSGTNSGIGNKLKLVIEENMMALWRKRKELAQIAADTKRMSQVFKALIELPGYGGSGFMAYELVTDLRWTHVFGPEGPTDIMTWSNPGPGAREGLNLIHNRPLNFRLRNDLLLEEMQELLTTLPSQLGPHIPPLELRDVEHCLCELSKYWRCLQGLGSTRSLYYNPDVGMPEPFAPKKHRPTTVKPAEEVVNTSLLSRIKLAWKVLLGESLPAPPVKRGRRARKTALPEQEFPQAQPNCAIDLEDVPPEQPADELKLTPQPAKPKRSHHKKKDPNAPPRRRGRPPKHRPPEGLV